MILPKKRLSNIPPDISKNMTNNNLLLLNKIQRERNKSITGLSFKQVENHKLNSDNLLYESINKKFLSNNNLTNNINLPPSNKSKNKNKINFSEPIKNETTKNILNITSGFLTNNHNINSTKEIKKKNTILFKLIKKQEETKNQSTRNVILTYSKTEKTEKTEKRSIKTLSRRKTNPYPNRKKISRSRIIKKKKKQRLNKLIKNDEEVKLSSPNSSKNKESEFQQLNPPVDKNNSNKVFSLENYYKIPNLSPFIKISKKNKGCLSIFNIFKCGIK